MKRINIIDLIKWLFSFFVIGLHTFYLKENAISHINILSTILNIAVPFFFITSGYLLFSKINLPLDNEGKKRIVKYLKRIFSMYLIWTLIYLPISIYGAWVGGAGIKEFIFYSIRKFLFVGESYYSWNLWYLHGLLISVLMVVCLLKFKIKPKYIMLIGITIFLCGIGLDKLLSMEINSFPVLLQKCLNLYLWLFERVRNGIFKGFPYVAIGLYLATKPLSKKLSIMLFIVGFILSYFKFEIGLIFFATGFFSIIIKIPLKDHCVFEYCRTTSVLIYLLHMIFVFVYLVLIKKNGFYEPINLFLYTSFISLGVTTIIYFLSKKIKWLRKLYGG